MVMDALKLKPGLRLGAVDTVGYYGTLHGPGAKRKIQARGDPRRLALNGDPKRRKKVVARAQ